MLTLQIKNFQAIADQTVVVDGLTVIEGANNTGKSCLIRAIKFMVSNQRGYWFVRHGTKYAEVSITVPEGHTVTWQKGKGVNRYQIDGGEWLAKNGAGKVPDQVRATLGIAPLDVGGHEIWPQIAKQDTPGYFLLSKTGAVLAEAVSDPERVGRLNQAIKYADKDLRESKSEVKVRDKDRTNLEDTLATYVGLDDLQPLMVKLRELVSQAQIQARGIEDVARLRDQLVKFGGVETRLAGVEGEDLSDHGAVERARKSQQAIQKVEQLRRKLDRARQAEASLDGIQASLEGIFGDDNSCQVKAQKAIKGLELVRRFRTELIQVRAREQQAQDKLAQAKADLETLNRRIKEELGALSECPLCGADIQGGDHGHVGLAH